MEETIPKKILVAMEDTPIRVSILHMLQSAGFAVTLGDSDAEIQTALNSTNPDLIVLNLALPGVDGLAVLEVIRGNPNPSLAATPIIVGSATGDIVEIGSALKFRINDYFINSSFDPIAFFSKVSKQLGMANLPPPIILVAAPLVSEGKPPKLLIVEDDKFLRDLATKTLEKQRLQVIAAVDGEQGIALAEQELPDIILLDILLPGIDGFEVLRRIRANPALAKTKVAMLSNFGQREDIEKALKLGADKFFVKANFTLGEIVAEVNELTASQKQHEHPPLN